MMQTLEGDGRIDERMEYILPPHIFDHSATSLVGMAERSMHEACEKSRVCGRDAGDDELTLREWRKKWSS